MTCTNCGDMERGEVHWTIRNGILSGSGDLASFCAVLSDDDNSFMMESFCENVLAIEEVVPGSIVRLGMVDCLSIEVDLNESAPLVDCGDSNAADVFEIAMPAPFSITLYHESLCMTHEGVPSSAVTFERCHNRTDGSSQTWIFDG